MQINATRMSKRIRDLSEIGKFGNTGVCRPALSKLQKQADDLASNWMEQAGMRVRVDNFGNLIGRLDGKNPGAPILMIGSHLDSQPTGGRFDGAVGVIGGIEVVATLRDMGLVPNCPIEVVSFCDEEGWRFNKGLFGSRGITGSIDHADLERQDEHGVTREQALREFGCNPDELEISVYRDGSIRAYLELHIEQGPVLETLDVPIGIVSGITGPLWLTVSMKGTSGHTGSVPMHLRKDPMLGVSKVIQVLNEIVTVDPDSLTLGSVASLNVSPNSRNVIPEKVMFTVDLRDMDLHRRNTYEEKLRHEIFVIADEHDLSAEITEDFRSEPRYCASWIKDTIRTASEDLGFPITELASGPFHDALALSHFCDYGMIFVRCKNGISHHPDEFASDEDITIGTETLYETVLRIVGLHN